MKIQSVCIRIHHAPHHSLYQQRQLLQLLKQSNECGFCQVIDRIDTDSKVNIPEENQLSLQQRDGYTYGS